VTGGGKAAHVADLGDDQHRGVTADALDLAEQLDALIGSRLTVDLLAGGVDLAIEVLEQRQQAVEALPGRLAQLERRQELSASVAEQVCMLMDHAVADQDRVHPTGTTPEAPKPAGPS
jgi:hypothetical protein